MKTKNVFVANISRFMVKCKFLVWSLSLSFEYSLVKVLSLLARLYGCIQDSFPILLLLYFDIPFLKLFCGKGGNFGEIFVHPVRVHCVS
jgi:hypothetical protein